MASKKKASKGRSRAREATPAERDGQRAQARKAFLLRLPPGVYADLKAWAANDLRSLNGQIEFLLREALKRRKGER